MIIKDKNGKTVQWMSGNRVTRIENGCYNHFCSKCWTNVKDMQFLKETGYYNREVTMKCRCGEIVKYGD